MPLAVELDDKVERRRGSGGRLRVAMPDIFFRTAMVHRLGKIGPQMHVAVAVLFCSPTCKAVGECSKRSPRLGGRAGTPTHSGNRPMRTAVIAAYCAPGPPDANAAK